MNAPSPTPDTGRGRRLLVAVVIATATAAVTAGVALNEHRPGEAVIQDAEAGPTAATFAAPDPTGRDQWRDPSTRSGRLSESAPSSLHETADPGAPASDTSLPAAADALRGADGATGEPAPTF